MRLKLLFFFVAYLPGFTDADPNKKICSINPQYEECLGLSNKRLVSFFKLE